MLGCERCQRICYFIENVYLLYKLTTRRRRLKLRQRLSSLANLSEILKNSEIFLHSSVDHLISFLPNSSVFGTHFNLSVLFFYSLSQILFCYSLKLSRIQTVWLFFLIGIECFFWYSLHMNSFVQKFDLQYFWDFFYPILAPSLSVASLIFIYKLKVCLPTSGPYFLLASFCYALCFVFFFHFCHLWAFSVTKNCFGWLFDKLNWVD